MAIDIMTIEEIAEFLKMSKSKIYRLAQQGKIPAVRIEGQWRFNRADIEKWFESQINIKPQVPTNE